MFAGGSRVRSGSSQLRIGLVGSSRFERSRGREAFGHPMVAELIQPFSCRGSRDQSAQAPEGIAAMPADVFAGERLDQVALSPASGFPE